MVFQSIAPTYVLAQEATEKGYLSDIVPMLIPGKKEIFQKKK